MLRVLLCMTCCAAPPSSRGAKRKPSTSVAAAAAKNPQENEEKQPMVMDFKSLITLTAGEKDQLIANKFEDAATQETAKADPDSQQAANDASEIGDRVVGPSSSMMLGDFVASDNDETVDINDNNNNDDADLVLTKRDTSGIEAELLSSSGSRNVPSTTKIGDYARIEYSPVEDLDSVTTMSYSRLGSERSAQRTASAAGSTPSRRNSVKTTDGSISRRSSDGVESTSISITSQLSNEQLQQNLTNMLETVNSPIQMFGTIGLPLGPPNEGTTTETAKTSPDTTGAALTSASQDSFSDTSLGNNNDQPIVQTLSPNSEALATGCALVSSIEDSVEIYQPQQTTKNPDDVKNVNSKPIVTSNEGSASLTPTTDRVESALSMSTTTSGGLTNPTPTPSEISGASTKKKRKLKVKSFLKFKSKKKNKESEPEIE